MISMKAEFTKDEVVYTITADDFSGNTFGDCQKFKMVVEQILYETVE